MVNDLLRVKLKSAVGSFELKVDFTAPLSLIVLFGPSGSGKSTLLDCIAGLRSPDEGLIAVGEEIFFDSASGINLAPQKRRLGYVFQQPTLFPHLSVRENIRFGIERWKPERRHAREEHLLDLLQLGRLADRRPSNLSGGESQRVALARAIAPEPQLLLLDEPFSALDQHRRDELGAELHSLQRSLSLPMVLVTHSRQEALALADLTICIQDGKLHKIGTADQVLLNLTSTDLGEDVQFSW